MFENTDDFETSTNHGCLGQIRSILFLSAQACHGSDVYRGELCYGVYNIIVILSVSIV